VRDRLGVGRRLALGRKQQLGEARHVIAKPTRVESRASPPTSPSRGDQLNGI
jgi:hypothetical protein